MDPISLVLLGMALFGGAAVVTIAYLTIDDLMHWFRDRRHLLRNRNTIAATVIKTIGSGKYRTVQGIFNTASNSWVQSRTLESDSISADLAYRHRGDGTAVYTV
ncbi:hypothetical protein Dvina_20490 [Dactylosporangium vinaceum]|uniref:Uncharacterized protein n=1 Tax=Dactylosporangium vinaceum TaxID=53362 RepID=A0ABV5MS74_9ACTN|nr:hypothetical protein [Dactylosporangium vinaceum]UAC00226.1 hypothetical protein Dvina_20490 [Dactylosporangium vinaceum]